jgi:hypothetical protein
VASPKRSLKVEIVGDSRDAVGALNRLRDSGQRTGGILKTALGTGLGMLASNAIASGARAISSGIGSIASTVVDMNSTLETSTLQFETLTGSAEKAEEIVAGLFEFAKATPFETGPIIEASKLMQTFGGDALNTQDNLKMIGDAAAASGAPINDLGFWVGRLYSNLEAGKPFGEAAARLQELAVLSPQARTQMEELQKSGASADEVFAAFSEDLERFGGAMEKQAGTWEGLTSTFSDTTSILMAEAFGPLFELAKEGLGGLNEVLGSEEFAARAQSFADTIATMSRSAIDSIRSLISGDLSITDVLSNVGERLSAWAQEVGPKALEFGQKFVAGLMETLPKINEQITQWGLALINWIGPRLPELQAKLYEFASTMFSYMIDTVLPGIIDRVTLWGGAAVRWIIEALPEMIQNLGTFALEILGKLADELPGFAKKLGEWGGELIGWILPRIPGILANLAEVLLKIAKWIITDGVPALVKAAWNLGKGLIDGILDGLSGIAAQIGNFLKEKIQAGIDAVKGFFGIGSPSRVTAREIGRPLMEGIAQGITEAADIPADALESVLGDLSSDVTVEGLSGDPGGSVGTLRGATTVVIPIELDGQMISEYTLDLMSGHIRQSARAAI